MIESYGILPSDIRYKKISSSAKIIWAEVYAYNYGKIYKIKNKTLANDLNLSVTQVSRIIKELIQANLLMVRGYREDRKLIVLSFSKTTKKKMNDSSKTKVKTINHKPSAALLKFWEMIDGK